MINGSDMLPLPRVERVALEHAPLVLALCQVQFSSVLGVAEPAVVAPFQRAIAGQYPVATTLQVGGLQLTIGLQAASAQPLAPSGQWQFSDREGIWQVVLAPNFVSLETRSYTDFGEFLERFSTVLTALSEHIRPEVGMRIGLRYINELRPGDRNWSRVIAPRMLGPLADRAFEANTEQVASLQQLTLRYPDHQGINIHHGVIPNGTTVRPRPSEQIPEGEFYLLDIDVYREFPLPSGLSVEPKRIREIVEQYHDVIYHLFRWSITDEYLATLKGD